MTMRGAIYDKKSLFTCKNEIKRKKRKGKAECVYGRKTFGNTADS